MHPSRMEFWVLFLNIASAVFYVDKCMGDVKFFFFVPSLLSIYMSCNWSLANQDTLFLSSFSTSFPVGDTSCYHRLLYIGLTFTFAE